MQINVMIQAIAFVSIMVYAAFWDIKRREIPPLAWGMIIFIAFLDFQVTHLLGILAAVPLVIISVWIAPNRLGGGDIKLVGATGLLLGLQATNFAMIIGLTLQVIIFLVMVCIKKLKKQEFKGIAFPLAPCLAVGFLVVYFMKVGGIFYAFI
jgi:leader peptidase (prepilin peptidase)/N-methyltransferase